ncbi:cellulase family glycosylhydrolase [Salinimicrobium sp. MT39]|uniref:mannan endo-1,4-beta-mannosidase n=1 Tax=Salinimicrobium profundisediminis TaxID=2994553 RepID=A0A9X3CW42_9FLAO|nr:cellulase family glycosylhydrolase [Salinimicrobium profundisediminis]MCX2837856.1 cellulase family glycosylhydrolase [Salinimicrobium profundisediminis]
MKREIVYYLLFLCVLTTEAVGQKFVQVEHGGFVHQGKPYHFLGTNFWYGMNLGHEDKERLVRELDRLEDLGVKNLRIMAGSEGAEGTPWRMQPTVQEFPGNYNEDLLQGLDFLLAEMKKRNMLAVVCLNNFWPWSGGFSQYVSWANDNEAIPYPPPAEGGDWGTYQAYASQFYTNETAKEWFRNFIRTIIERENSLTGVAYKEDTTIMAWQLTNEPQGGAYEEAYRNWLHNTAKFIKELDGQHLVSIGSEGNTPSPQNGTNFRKDHDSPYIDYATFHVWIQNWGWYDPERAEETFDDAILKASAYIQDHFQVANELNIPIVLEEFGISRDANSHHFDASVSYRNRYFDFIFSTFFTYAKSIPQVSGVNFWAWGGEGRPRKAGAIWRPGDDFIGDPPHELQGWYSIYDHDATTLKLISRYSSKFSKLSNELK